MRKTDHTIKPELKDKYEVVTPVPKLNIPELVENACVKPKDNDFEYIIHVSPVSKRNQACDECGSISYHGDGKSKDRKVQDMILSILVGKFSYTDLIPMQLYRLPHNTFASLS